MASIAPTEKDITEKLSSLIEQKLRLMSQPPQHLNNYGTPNYASTTDTMREFVRLKAENRQLKRNQRGPERDNMRRFWKQIHMCNRWTAHLLQMSTR